MYRIAKSNTDNRRILFRNTAAKMHVHEAIVEKDFWVCLTLEYLFHQCKYNDAFAFKGGTSLSKAWHVIERFSEDIDLILDWRFLGYALKEPWKERSKKQQELFNKAVNVNAAQFIGEELAPLLKTDLSRILGVDADISVDEHDPQTINFNYPHIFVSSSLTQSIKLEIGPLAAWTPARKTLITPFCATQYPQVFVQNSTEILTTLPERTFWEKATILHHEAHRPQNSVLPSRYSRHYYDLYRLANSYVKEKAFSNLELLHKVVEFKKKFYPRGWAKFEEAKPGTFSLMPPKHNEKDLKNDYKSMIEMLYGDSPDFDTILWHIKNLQDEINALHEPEAMGHLCSNEI